VISRDRERKPSRKGREEGYSSFPYKLHIWWKLGGGKGKEIRKKKTIFGPPLPATHAMSRGKKKEGENFAEKREGRGRCSVHESNQILICNCRRGREKKKKPKNCRSAWGILLANAGEERGREKEGGRKPLRTAVLIKREEEKEGGKGLGKRGGEEETCTSETLQKEGGRKKGGGGEK